MTPAEEDRILEVTYDKMLKEALSVELTIRLAIRAAVAQEKTALDAKDERIRELEGALREFMRVDEIGRDPNTHAESWRPMKRAAVERAREALK